MQSRFEMALQLSPEGLQPLFQGAHPSSLWSSLCKCFLVQSQYPRVVKEDNTPWPAKGKKDKAGWCVEPQP